MNPHSQEAPGLQPGYFASNSRSIDTSLLAVNRTRANARSIHVSTLGQAHTRAAGSECRSLLPHNGGQRLCPNVYTIHIVKERSAGAQKNPGGCEPTGVSVWSFPGRFEYRAFQELFSGRLNHRFPTNRGERITTVKRRMRRYDVHIGQACAAVSIDVGIRLPAPCGGG